MSDISRSRKRHGLCCFSEKPTLPSDKPLEDSQVADLAGIFKTLSNKTRLRLLHAIFGIGEASPSILSELIGMKPQAICNQLQKLVDRQILESRRDGNNVLYRIVDPCVVDLLERGLWLLEDTKIRGAKVAKSIP